MGKPSSADFTVVRGLGTRNARGGKELTDVGNCRGIDI